MSLRSLPVFNPMPMKCELTVNYSSDLLTGTRLKPDTTM